ncbi:hypothetical protein HPB51_008343 [Rhipicephalus microplus]|uniref:Uncharacterized protein n=1 Tax=Rhipicephalus microplus TaxID=6941 RepID=A0A9J6ERK0_RHIMP|nr:hypothetical protein HPB51_008343 [Rhipicephalus microplus]
MKQPRKPIEALTPSPQPTARRLIPAPSSPLSLEDVDWSSISCSEQDTCRMSHSPLSSECSQGDDAGYIKLPSPDCNLGRPLVYLGSLLGLLCAVGGVATATFVLSGAPHDSDMGIEPVAAPHITAGPSRMLSTKSDDEEDLPSAYEMRKYEFAKFRTNQTTTPQTVSVTRPAKKQGAAKGRNLPIWRDQPATTVPATHTTDRRSTVQPPSQAPLSSGEEFAKFRTNQTTAPQTVSVTRPAKKQGAAKGRNLPIWRDQPATTVPATHTTDRRSTVQPPSQAPLSNGEGCGVGLKVDPSVEADGEEADAKCRQCEVEEKMEKMMVAQSELLVRITELETALATEQEKTRAMGERLKSAEEALAKLNKEATYRENSREPANRTVEKEKRASLEKTGLAGSTVARPSFSEVVVGQGGNKAAGVTGASSPQVQNDPTEKSQHVIIAGDSNLNRCTEAIKERVRGDKRVAVGAFPERKLEAIMRQASAKLKTTADRRNLVIISGGLNDVLNEDAAGLAATLAKGVDDMRATSPKVQIVICTIPEVPVRDSNLQRAVVNANQEIWRMSREKGSARPLPTDNNKKASSSTATQSEGRVKSIESGGMSSDVDSDVTPSGRTAPAAARGLLAALPLPTKAHGPGPRSLICLVEGGGVRPGPPLHECSHLILGNQVLDLVQRVIRPARRGSSDREPLGMTTAAMAEQVRALRAESAPGIRILAGLRSMEVENTYVHLWSNRSGLAASANLAYEWVRRAGLDGIALTNVVLGRHTVDVYEGFLKRLRALFREDYLIVFGFFHRESHEHDHVYTENAIRTIRTLTIIISVMFGVSFQQKTRLAFSNASRGRLCTFTVFEAHDVRPRSCRSFVLNALNDYRNAISNATIVSSLATIRSLGVPLDQTCVSMSLAVMRFLLYDRPRRLGQVCHNYFAEAYSMVKTLVRNTGIPCVAVYNVELDDATGVCESETPYSRLTAVATALRGATLTKRTTAAPPKLKPRKAIAGDHSTAEPSPSTVAPHPRHRVRKRVVVAVKKRRHQQAS